MQLLLGPLLIMILATGVVGTVVAWTLGGTAIVGFACGSMAYLFTVLVAILSDFNVLD